MSVTQIFAAQPWVELLGLTLLHFLWQGAVIVAIYAAARKLSARSLRPNGRYLLACVAFTSLAVAPVVTWMRLYRSSPRDAATVTASMFAARTEPAGPLSPAVPSDARPVIPRQFLPWVVTLWLAGATSFSVRLILAWMGVRHLRYSMARPVPAGWQKILEQLKRRLSVTQPVRLLVSGLVEAPGRDRMVTSGCADAGWRFDGLTVGTHRSASAARTGACPPL